MYDDLVNRLREKPSKYNRELLDEAAEAIEKLTKSLEEAYINIIELIAMNLDLAKEKEEAELEKSAKTEAKPIEKSTEMTEAEIMKALECCEAYNYDACSECPFNRNADCAFAVATNCLDLLNRKNAENEKLNFENLQMIASIKNLKAEAIKEFAERVIKEGEKNVDYYTPEGCDLFFRNGTSCGYVVMKNTIAQIAKEMGVE